MGRLAAPQRAVSTKTGHGVTHTGNEGTRGSSGGGRGLPDVISPWRQSRGMWAGGGSAVGPQRGTAGPRRHRSRAMGQALKAASPEVRGAILPRAHGTSSSLLVLAAARWGGGGSAVLAGWSRDDPALRSPRGWKSFLRLGTARLWSPSRCPGESPRPLARPRSYAESPPLEISRPDTGR